MTDRERLLVELTTAGSRGLHSLDIRRAGLSGNPSQRVRELRDRGYVIASKRERQGHRNGTRYFLDVGSSAGFPPSVASARSGVESNGGARSDTGEGPALDAGLSLFEPEPAKPRGYGDLEDAA